MQFFSWTSPRYPRQRFHPAAQAARFNYLDIEDNGKVTISLGISAFPEHAQKKMPLIKAADMALYECKRKGRNCSTIYPTIYHPGLNDDN